MYGLNCAKKMKYFGIISRLCQKMGNFAKTHTKFDLVITIGEFIGKADQMLLKLLDRAYRYKKD